jgi:predicted phage terminase large subunit-like protein
VISPKILRLSLTRRSLGRFAQVVMPSFEVDPCHQLIIDNLEFLLNGKIKKLAIITPPRHGKSTLGNVILPAFALGRNPTETIITVSYGSDLSEGFGRRTRNILSDPAFAEVFPGCKLSPDSAAVYRFTTTANGEYSAVGRGGPVTGRGASLLILDDLIKDSSEANSDVTCRNIIDWLQHVAFTRLTPNGRVLAIATRWSERDPMGWILQQHGWTVLHLPALAESPNDPLGREIGEALWPSHYPVEALEQIRADVGSRVFQCLYQGNVAASQGTIFKRDWFQHYHERPERFTRIVQSWDTSFKSGQYNDYSVCATIGQTETGFYLLSLWRDKVEFPTLKQKVAELADQWRPSEIYIEDRASGQSLIQELKSATNCPVVAVHVDRDKETRASATTGYYEAGKVFFPAEASWLTALEDELASFPGGLHDDIVDALSQALNQLRDSGGVLGLLVALKDFFTGKRKMPPSVEELQSVAESKPAVTQVDNFQIWLDTHKSPPCPHCQSPSTTYLSKYQLHCNACGAENGIPPAKAADRCGCGNPLLVYAGGRLHCNSCSWDEPAPVVVGVSRRDYERGVGRLRGQSLSIFETCSGNSRERRDEVPELQPDTHHGNLQHEALDHPRWRT